MLRVFRCLCAAAVLLSFTSSSQASLYGIPRSPEGHLEKMKALAEIADLIVTGRVDCLSGQGVRTRVHLTVGESLKGDIPRGAPLSYLDFYTLNFPVSAGETLLLFLSRFHDHYRLTAGPNRYSISPADSVVAVHGLNVCTMSAGRDSLASAFLSWLPEAMAARADLVVRAGIAGMALTDPDGVPTTDTRVATGDIELAILEVYKARSREPVGNAISLHVDTRSTRRPTRAAIPPFSVGEECVLFLAGPSDGKYVLLRGAHAKYLLTDDSAVVEIRTYFSDPDRHRLCSLPAVELVQRATAD